MITKRNINEIAEHHHAQHENYEYYIKPLVKRSETNQCKAAFYSIPPKKSNYPYHYHLQNEEVFYIISGGGMLKTPDGDIPVSAGDTIYFPANEKGAHKLTNTSDTEMLVYLDFNTHLSTDVCIYPDSNKIGVYDLNGICQIHNRDEQVDYYDGE